MIWFLKSRQAQTLKDSSVVNSTLQQTQAGRDALSFQNVEQVTIVYNGLFGSRSIASGIDWEWAGRVIHEQQAEVRNRLKYVLRDRDPLSLQLSEQPERVNLPALESERRLTIAGEDSELLDPGQLMIEVFGRGDIAGKLLILGTPGAGKTTLLLSLAEQLLAGANTQACAEGYDNPKTVIPVIFELSTWKNDNQSIQDWLIEQLYDLYGGDRKLKRYEQWLEQRVLLPLLDGLDELGMERQQKCMAKLNDFTRQYPQVVVCCRSKEFEESEIRLGNLRGAVELEPLSDRQIQTYLQQVEREGLWQQIQETPEMRQMLEPNNGEAGLLRVPLFVSLAAAIYDRNQPFRTKGELLERYVDRQLSFDVRMSDRRRELERRDWAYPNVGKEPAIKATRHYLTWLSNQLNAINEVTLLIEDMQPGWLNNKFQKWHYWILLFIGNTLITGIITTLVFLQWASSHHQFSWTVGTNQIFLLICFLGGFILSTETKADGARLISYLLLKFVFFLLNKRLPEKFEEHIPILHDAYLSLRFRVRFPSLICLKNKVVMPALAIAIFESDYVFMPLILFVEVVHISSAGLLHIAGFNELSTLLKNSYDDINRNSYTLADEVDDSRYRHYLVFFFSTAQYVQLLKQRGGRILNTIFNILRFFPACLIFAFFLIVNLVAELFTEDIKQSLLPNQGLKESIRTAFCISSFFGIALLPNFRSLTPYHQGISVLLGILVCFSYLSLIKHLSLRFVFYLSSTLSIF